MCPVSRGHQIYGFDESFTFVKPRLVCKLGLLEKSAIYLHNQIIFLWDFMSLGGALWSFLIAI